MSQTLLDKVRAWVHAGLEKSSRIEGLDGDELNAVLDEHINQMSNVEFINMLDDIAGD